MTRLWLLLIALAIAAVCLYTLTEQGLAYGVVSWCGGVVAARILSNRKAARVERVRADLHRLLVEAERETHR